ncbi:MAG TPA: hypothetical protein PKM56_16190 [Candidatus Rifleibacterium sp.]|nr:hypothetical protein [Candidatus Rifleibacterium sp.]
MAEPEITNAGTQADADQSDVSWPDELCFGNIRAVPSYHYYPEFATIVRQQIGAFRPDMVAVEVPGIYEAAMVRAVSYLPEITALVTPKDEMFPITPEDSLVEAVRLALAKGIKIACVDLEITESRRAESGFTGSLADPGMLGHMDLLSFMRLNAGKMGETTDNIAFRRREEHMAHHLQKLAKAYKRVLFVCGMAHWKRIRAHLAGRPAKFQHDAGNDCMICELPVGMFFQLTGSTPYRTAAYERARAAADFSMSGWLTSLFVEAADLAGRKLSPADIKDLLTFSRNRRIVNGFLEPTLPDIVAAAACIIDDDFAAAVEQKCFEYPFFCHEKNFTKTVKFNGLYYIDYKGGKLPLKLHPAARPVPMPAGKPEKSASGQRNSGRRHPDEEFFRDNPDLFLSGAWGRYVDEMEAEERFISTLERWAGQSDQADDHLSVEFSDGLLDGIDVRETIRDFEHERIFVREYLREEARFSMVIVEFDSNLSRYVVPIYTYGRHKALAFCAEAVPSEKFPGTASKEFGLLVSFKRSIDNARLGALSEEMYRRFSEAQTRNAPESAKTAKSSKKPDQRDILTRVAFMMPECGDVLVVAPRSSLKYYHDRAARLEDVRRKKAGIGGQLPPIRIFTLAREDVWNRACEKIKKFNIKYHI